MAARVERLRITLCDLLKVVSITLEADDNAQVIFETLNARGTPLLALDLVRTPPSIRPPARGVIPIRSTNRSGDRSSTTATGAKNAARAA